MGCVKSECYPFLGSLHCNLNDIHVSKYLLPRGKAASYMYTDIRGFPLMHILSSLFKSTMYMYVVCRVIGYMYTVIF